MFIKEDSIITNPGLRQHHYLHNLPQFRCCPDPATVEKYSSLFWIQGPLLTFLLQPVLHVIPPQKKNSGFGAPRDSTPDAKSAEDMLNRVPWDLIYQEWWGEYPPQDSWCQRTTSCSPGLGWF